MYSYISETNFESSTIIIVSTGYRVKGKYLSRTGNEDPEGGREKYNCTLSLTSALDGVGGHCHVPAALHP